MFSLQSNNEDNKINKIKNIPDSKIFKKVDLKIKLSKTPKKIIYFKSKKIKLPFLDINKEIKHHKINHIQNFCNSLYSNYNSNEKNNTIIDIYNPREQINEFLNDSNLKAVEDIKHYFFINKFPNEVNFRKNTINDLYKKIFASGNRTKPISLNKIKDKTNLNNDEEKFSLITTLNVKKEKEEKNDKNKIYHSIDSYTTSNKNKNRKFNFEDYAINNINIKHPILYKLNFDKKRKSNLPAIRRKNKIFNDIVEISKLIPDKTEINKENKIINYDEYMKMKELKILK